MHSAHDHGHSCFQESRDCGGEGFAAQGRSFPFCTYYAIGLIPGSISSRAGKDPLDSYFFREVQKGLIYFLIDSQNRKFRSGSPKLCLKKSCVFLYLRAQPGGPPAREEAPAPGKPPQRAAGPRVSQRLRQRFPQRDPGLGAEHVFPDLWRGGQRGDG